MNDLTDTTNQQDLPLHLWFSGYDSYCGDGDALDMTSDLSCVDCSECLSTLAQLQLEVPEWAVVS